MKDSSSSLLKERSSSTSFTIEFICDDKNFTCWTNFFKVLGFVTIVLLYLS